MRPSLDDIRGDVNDLKLRMTNVEGSLGQVISQVGYVQTQLAGQALRMDRIDERIARIERRLDTVSEAKRSVND